MTTQVDTWEASAHPGLTAEVPFSTREFLEVEVATTEQAVQEHGVAHAETSGDGGGGVCAGGGERLVIYPARNGHASYHKPKRCAILRRMVNLQRTSHAQETNCYTATAKRC